jgi:hypothetical protein
VADVGEGTRDLADHVVRAVLVAGDDDTRDPVAGHRPALVVGSDSSASIRSSTRWATEDGRPSQVGEAMTRICAPSSLAWTPGQASP